MGLVGYSDSEGSDDETIKSQGSAEKAAAPSKASQTASKPLFKKDETNPRKIRVQLPDTGTESDAFAENDRPVKKARTDGAFSSFNSFLPAPKNPSASSSAPGRTASSETGKQASSQRPGVNLKTSAHATFSREAPEEYHAPAVEEPEVKLVGKTSMFKPLSITNKKKKPLQSKKASTPAASNGPARDGAAIEALSVDIVTQAPPPKRSLFSSYEEPLIPQATSLHGMEETLENGHDRSECTDGQVHGNNQPVIGELNGHPDLHGQGDDLLGLADEMGLSASERRRLFGRTGKPQGAKVAHFDLSAEYAHNNEMIANQETAPAQTIVRSIAPGKHSLQQLLNAAANQKEALEESFATGRRNKKDAGNKYGW